MKKILLTICLIINFQQEVSSQNKLLQKFPDEYLIYSQENFFILDFFVLNDEFKLAFVGGENGAYSLLLNEENLVSDTFLFQKKYLKVIGLTSMGEDQFLANTDIGLFSFSINNAKIDNLKCLTTNYNKRYDLAYFNNVTLYMKPKDVIRNKLKWRVQLEGEDTLLYESDSKFSEYKNVILPIVWNKIYFIDSVFVFNDPLNKSILTYNPISGNLESISYETNSDELRFLYVDTIEKRCYLVGFTDGNQSFNIYEIEMSKPLESTFLKNISHHQPPKGISGGAVYLEDAFLETDKNCIVRIPLN